MTAGYEQLERSERKAKRVVDHAAIWQRLPRLADVNGSTRERVERFANSKRITVEALVALGARVAIRKSGQVELAFAGDNGRGAIVAIKYRPLDGSSHDSYAESPSTWLRPIIVGDPFAKDWAIAEGETDGARLVHLVGDAVTVMVLPAGADTFKPEWAALIPRGATVALCHDADAKGDAGAERAAKLIGGKTRRLRPPTEGGDWCEWDGERNDFLELARQADASKPTRRWQLQPLSQATSRQTRWLVPGLIPLRFLTLVAGVGGLGKSTWLLGLAAAGSVAAEPWETIYVSFEDTADEVLRPRVEAAGGDPNRVHELVLTDTDSLESFALPRDVEELHTLVQERSARLVVIDPIVAAVEAKLDAYKDQHVRQVLARLWRISREENCAIAMVGHLNRVPSTDAYLRVANSTAFWNAARSVVLITHDGDDESDLRLIAQRKANLARLAPIERYQLEEIVLDTVDPETGNRLVTSRMRFVETAEDVNASEILGPQATTKTETAESLLEILLGNGEWRESKEIQKVLTAAGFNERLAQRAAKDLGVEYDRRGFPSVTWWRLVATGTGSEDVATVHIAQPSGSNGALSSVATTSMRAGDDVDPGRDEEIPLGDEPLFDADAGWAQGWDTA